MVEEKGLEPSVADKIGTFVKLKGGEALLQELLKNEELTKNKRAKEGLSDIQVLFKYLEAYNVLDRVYIQLISQIETGKQINIKTNLLDFL